VEHYKKDERLPSRQERVNGARSQLYDLAVQCEGSPLIDGSSVAELTRERMGDLTAGERNVARALLADYPDAGLGSLAELARRAEVSEPTAMRFAVKLGFHGYPHLQRALREEIRIRLSSPLNLYESQRSERADSPEAIREIIPAVVRNVEHISANLIGADFERTLKLLGNPRLNIYCLGHTFSHAAAYYLHFHLARLRPKVHLLESGLHATADSLVDLGRRDVLVVFDYRRYHPGSAAFASAAAAQGTSIVLFTDAWLSPISRIAETVLQLNVDVPSPCDSLTAVIAMTDALLAGLVGVLGSPVGERMRRLEAARAALAAESADGGAVPD
jgi:DNA-binding MurR/RpiR family transcriptional regulator